MELGKENKKVLKGLGKNKKKGIHKLGNEDDLKKLGNEDDLKKLGNEEDFKELGNEGKQDLKELEKETKRFQGISKGMFLKDAKMTLE